MEDQNTQSALAVNSYEPDLLREGDVAAAFKSVSKEDVTTVFKTLNEFVKIFRQKQLANLDDLLAKIAVPASKKSFLVFKHQKYVTIPTENIAFFYVKNECPVIACFDGQEYMVNYSLEQIQNLLPNLDFFRLNRQYLINFNAIKEVEHYFARKLFVKLAVPVAEKLLVSKEKSTLFLKWLEER